MFMFKPTILIQLRAKHKCLAFMTFIVILDLLVHSSGSTSRAFKELPCFRGARAHERDASAARGH